MSEEFDFATSEITTGLSVIEASAGTGKTYAISHLVPRLLLDGTVSRLDEILLVTFTNDAARELSDRVRRVFEVLHAHPAPDEPRSEPGVHRLRTAFASERIAGAIGRALLDIDRLDVSTIHSFCQRTLQNEGALCGMPVMPELVPDADDVVTDALHDVWRARIASDRRAAALAAAKGWTLDDDLRFLRKALDAPGAEPAPVARPFDDVLAAIDGMAVRFDPAVCEELSAALDGVTFWSVSAPEPASRAQIVEILRRAAEASPEFLAAVAEVANAGKWAKGGGQARNDAQKRVADSTAVALARETVGLFARARWDFRHEMVTEIRERTRTVLRENRRITFDGLIDALHEGLQGPRGAVLSARLRDRYRIALIDESQDTDPRQFEIFRSVFLDPGTPRRLLLVGDPKQAIYAFRGADVNTYLAARELARNKVFRLTRTYRAPEPLVQAVNAVFSGAGALLKDHLDFVPANSGLEGDLRLERDGDTGAARIEAWIAPDGAGDDYARGDRRTARIAAEVASEIVRILNGNGRLVHESAGGPRARPVGPGDIAVLVSTHDEAAAVEHALERRDVPAIRAGAEDIMAAEEAGELLVLLRAVHEPKRAALRMAALATRLLGCGAAEIQEIRASAARDDEWLQRFLSWQALWHRDGIGPALARMDHDCGMVRRLAALESGERRVTNFRQLSDLLQAASVATDRHPARLLRWLSREIARAGFRGRVDERLMQLESDAEAVQVVTMHAAKGLEYPLVFCPFLWTARQEAPIEKLARPGESTLLVDTRLNEDPSVSLAIRRNAMEERLRLAYVAMTRARAKVWIHCGELCGAKNRPPASAIDWLLRGEDVAVFETWIGTANAPGRGARHAAAWDALAVSVGTPGVLARREPPAPSEERWVSPAPTQDGVLTALPSPTFPAPWRMTSFSALTREKHARGVEDARSSAPVLEGNIAENPFLAAPGGALLGTAVHDWIERWDFSPPDESAIASHLDGYPLRGPMAGGLGGRIAGMLEMLRHAVLPGLGCRVSEACMNPAASEWHFQLPIGGALGSRRLSEVFAVHGRDDYAALLAALPVEELAGYLHGFLDRIAFHEGTWGVVDWKTNNLGPRVSDYCAGALEACAMRSHYLLQTHLYLVALRRYLGPGARIAGAWLVFLRGVRSGTSDGILHINPGEATLAALDGLFARSAS